jgi:hypothetical protein
MTDPGGELLTSGFCSVYVGVECPEQAASEEAGTCASERSIVRLVEDFVTKKVRVVHASRPELYTNSQLHVTEALREHLKYNSMAYQVASIDDVHYNPDLIVGRCWYVGLNSNNAIPCNPGRRDS